MFQFLQKIIPKDPKRFYLERVAHYDQSFQNTVNVVIQEYNSPVHQTRINNYMRSLRVSDFVKMDNETSVALEKVYKLVTKLERKVPASHCDFGVGERYQ